MWFYSNRRAKAAEYKLELLKLEYIKLRAYCFKSDTVSKDTLDTAIAIIRRILNESNVDRSYWNGRLLELTRLRETVSDVTFLNPKEFL